MKKLIALTLSIFMAALLFAGCGKTEKTDVSNSKEDKPVLNVSVFAQEHEQAMYREVISRFEEKYNCTVNFQVAGDQYWPELEAALTANAAPDVFYLGLGDIKRRVWADKIVPLDDLLDVSSLDKIWPVALNLYRYDVENDKLGEGKLWALPKDFSAVPMTVNKAIIEKRRPQIEELVEKGILPFFPEIDENGNLPVYTFTEFAILCKTLTFEDPTLPETAGSKQVYGTHLWEDFCLQPFIWGAGGDYLNEDATKVLFDTPEFIEGYEGFMKIVEMGGSGLSTDEVTGYMKFLAGRVAYFPCGTWDVGAFQAIEDDESINPGKSWFDFDLAPWPISDRYADLSIEERQDKWFGRIDSVGYCVSKQSKNQKLAAELAYVLSADEEVQRFLAKRGGQVPNIVSMAKGEYLTDDSYFPESREIFIRMLEGKNGRRVPTSLTFNAIWHTEGFISGVDSVWSYYEGIDKGVKPMSVSEYCKSVQPKAQELLDQAIRDEAALNPFK
ncbi:extracellular solute-binding protein family 1 [Thermoclostridium stercorarium subsp. stercorarium DSM 8532]|jgi:multiple sugar transport system substrate-binding protein|uniref:Extracellular solute-binding protein family 1 n=2 Tax=Thermoclostridium stercorarium TaxID=1510 RepID=L7VLZ0_THES1|nr:extracellular solute-binding protein [Thermoclostridium stercorarium]AGC67526.1 extracellular solute-binding protein family 1 [Thermoclostridium stercorarium subsp. stercorarium DSM 8532]AGI38578.1 ABC transporter periplasmic subunit [Thermoclostridium stercorarium subsp. stercorarium DSM 8532]ANX00501.1 ABC transporter substrate-binding protein [Thermoclostridium stercorarium subsp. leptospartum DSM 9219]UZQ86112.1 extracellular solute-binding protein [Thermoclostridium stercorarium]